MAKSDNPRDERNLVLEEHRELIRHVSELDDWAAPNTARERGWGNELGRRAAEVTERLKMHFAGDAEGTFFADVAQQSPHLIGKLTSLTAEHAEILKEFRQVAESATALDPADSMAATRVAMQARRAVATLRRHEAEENELIFSAFWDDLGVKD